jgi:hypothetical protein
LHGSTLTSVECRSIFLPLPSGSATAITPTNSAQMRLPGIFISTMPTSSGSLQSGVTVAGWVMHSSWGDLGFGANRNAKALGLTSIFCVGDRTHLPMGDSIHLPICMQNISVRIPRLFKIKDLRRIQFLHRFWLRANRNGWLLTRCVQDGVRCLRLFFPDLRPSSLNSGRNFGRQLNAQGFHDRQSRL